MTAPRRGHGPSLAKSPSRLELHEANGVACSVPAGPPGQSVAANSVAHCGPVGPPGLPAAARS
eukprot:14450926-Alexandrium_andersonii.AAC.1